jgi:hypothetical protein
MVLIECVGKLFDERLLDNTLNDGWNNLTIG